MRKQKIVNSILNTAIKGAMCTIRVDAYIDGYKYIHKRSVFTNYGVCICRDEFSVPIVFEQYDKAYLIANYNNIVTDIKNQYLNHLRSFEFKYKYKE